MLWWDKMQPISTRESMHRVFTQRKARTSAGQSCLSVLDSNYGRTLEVEWRHVIQLTYFEGHSKTLWRTYTKHKWHKCQRVALPSFLFVTQYPFCSFFLIYLWGQTAHCLIPTGAKYSNTNIHVHITHESFLSIFQLSHTAQPVIVAFSDKVFARQQRSLSTTDRISPFRKRYTGPLKVSFEAANNVRLCN